MCILHALAAVALLPLPVAVAKCLQSYFFFLYTYIYKLFLLFTAKALAQLAEHQTGALTEQKFPFMKNLDPKSALDSSCCGLVRSLFSCKVCKHVVDAGGNTQTWCTNSAEEQV